MTNLCRKNIYVIGAQSTGKTTLVNALNEHFNKQLDFDASHTPAVISEVARTVLKRLGIVREELSSSPKRCLMFQEAILQAQFDAETTLQTQGSWFISDRSAVDPVVYAKLLVSDTAAAAITASPHWKVLEQNMKDGLVFLCESGCQWLIDDGVRLMPKDDDEWMCVDMAFRSLLRERGIIYTVIQKHLTVSERVSLVMKRLEGQLTVIPAEDRLSGEAPDRES